MNRYVKIAGVGGVFVVSFVFFAYLVFPYEVAKEIIAKEASSMSGLDIEIDNLEPKLFGLGFNFDKVTLKSPGQAGITFKEIDVSVGLLNLMMLDLNVNLDASVAGIDNLSLDANVGLIGLALHQNVVPHRVKMSSEKFPVGKFVNFILKSQGQKIAADPNMDPVIKTMVPPLMRDVEFVTELDANVDIDLDVANPNESSGVIDLNFKKTQLVVNDPGLGIPNQTFTKALIKANIKQGKINFDNNSGLQSADLTFSCNGTIDLKPQLLNSVMNLKSKVTLAGPLKDQFGVVLPLIGSQKEDEVSLDITGTLGAPGYKTF